MHKAGRRVNSHPIVRVGLGSVVLFVAGTFAVYALYRATDRIEADSTGLRESSAVCWRMTPWRVLRGTVDETVYHYRRLTSSSRSSLTLEHVTQRVYFTDDQGEEVVSIDDKLVPEQAKALLAHVLGRTGLQPEKREIGKK